METPKRLEVPRFWIEHIPFAFFLIPRLKPEIFVELGTHSGNSFFAFCQTVKYSGLSTKCYAIDTWLGDKHSLDYGEEVYESVVKHKETNYNESVKLLRMTFNKAVSTFSDRSIDLLHIDGMHTYEEVKHDFETWLPKLSQKAVVLFHDTQIKMGDFGVWKCWEELTKKYPSFEFTHGCGLGVLAVGNAVPEEVMNFIKEASKNNGYQVFFENEGKKVLKRYKKQQAWKKLESVFYLHRIIAKRLK